MKRWTDKKKDIGTQRQKHSLRKDERQRETETQHILFQRREERGSKGGTEKRETRTGEKGSGREHITLDRLCHGVNGVLPLPIIPVPFEPWPLHTERSLTLSSASSRGLVSSSSAGRLVSKDLAPASLLPFSSALRALCDNAPALAA